MQLGVVCDFKAGYFLFSRYTRTYHTKEPRDYGSTINVLKNKTKKQKKRKLVGRRKKRKPNAKFFAVVTRKKII